MRDAIKEISVRDSLNQIALAVDLQAVQDQLVAVPAKAKVSPDGMIGWQASMLLGYSADSSTQHARGFVGGAPAGLTGSIEQLVSGGVKNQRPSNGGPFAIIYGKETNI
jgi:cyanuric acid amidohydrolase